VLKPSAIELFFINYNFVTVLPVLEIKEDIVFRV
jgi:hypothetical protein